MAISRGIDRRSGGQAVVEYMLTTLILSMAFITLYGVMQNSIKNLFTRAGVLILTTYTGQ